MNELFSAFFSDKYLQEHDKLIDMTIVKDEESESDNDFIFSATVMRCFHTVCEMILVEKKIALENSGVNAILMFLGVTLDDRKVI